MARKQMNNNRRGKKKARKNSTLAALPYIIGAAAIGYASTLFSANRQLIPSNAWKSCSIFTAPSKLPGGGWGVFAARPFRENEIVEIAPLYVPLGMKSPSVKNTALDDYVYKSDFYNGKGAIERAIFPSLGYISLNNHHPKPNVSWNWVGRPPHPNRLLDDDAKSFAVIYKATRAIEAGEELYSNYGQSQDGGEVWFTRRGLTLQAPTTDSRWEVGKELDDVMEQYCPKLYSGPGLPTWDKVELSNRLKNGEPAPFYDKSRLAPVDAGYEHVIAKTSLREGDVIEHAPALVIRKSLTVGTELEGLVFGWDHLAESHQAKLKQLRSDGYITMQYQGDDTKRPDMSWKREDRWDGFDEVALFPMGSIGMVQRVGNAASSNCRLEIRSSVNLDERDDAGMRGNAGLFLVLVATTNIKSGEVLTLNLPGVEQNKELLDGLKRMGQPVVSKVRVKEEL